MEILITGASGFLGGRLGEYFKTKNNNLHLASRRKLQDNHNFSSTKIIEWNSYKSLDYAVKNIETIIHLAGMNAEDCNKNEIEARRVNEGYTKALLSAAIENNVKNFVYLSTAHVYASPLKGSLNESSPINGTHPYATSHFLGEQTVLEAHKKKLINSTIIRLSNAFGAPINKDVNCWMLLVNDLCKQLAKSNKMVIRTSGRQRRNFITITEVSKAIDHLINRNEYYEDPIFNVGSSLNLRIKDMVNIIALRYELITCKKPMIIFGTNNDDIEYELDYSINKLIKSGFKPASASVVESEIDRLIKFSIDFFGDK